MNPSTSSIAAARRAEAALTLYRKAIDNLAEVIGQLDGFPVESQQFQDMLEIGTRLSAYSVEAEAIEEAVLDVAWEITNAVKAAA